MSNFSLFIITSVLFGGSFIEEFIARYQEHPFKFFRSYTSSLAEAKYSIWAILFPTFYRKLPLAKNKKLKRDIDILRDAAKIAIDKRLENKTRKYEQLDENMDFLDTIIFHGDISQPRVSQSDLKYLDADRKMDKEDIVDQAMMFVQQSVGPLGRALEYNIMNLGLHQDWQERLREEVDNVFQHDSVTQYMSFDEKLAQLQDMIVYNKEVLRMFPPTSESDLKIATEAHFLTDGQKKFHIPKNTILRVGYYLTHMNPKLWENPEVFDPERFRNPEFHPFSYLAFGAGPRICIGKNFSLMIIRVFLAELLKKCKVQDLQCPKFVQKLQMEPQNPIKITVVPKRPKQN